MDPWPAFVAATLARHGVATAGCAARYDISPNRFFTRTAREGWLTTARGVRIHPSSPTSIQQQVLAACLGTSAAAAATGETTAWLHGLRARPPRRSEVAVASTTHGAQVRRVEVRRFRWLGVDDITERDGVPVLLPAPWLLAAGPRTEPARLRARVIDLLHRGELDVPQLLDRFDAAGPVPGKRASQQLVLEMSGLRQESIFQATVAEELLRRGVRSGAIDPHDPGGHRPHPRRRRAAALVAGGGRDRR